MKASVFNLLCLALVLSPGLTTAKTRFTPAIAETLLLHQRDSGGWPKNYEWGPATDADRERLTREKDRNDATIDNGATWKEIRYLAEAYAADPDARYRRAVVRGVSYLLRAQYPNGGWPQYYPKATGYHRHITFNDNAMVGVLSLLRDVARALPPLDTLGDRTRRQAAAAVTKGIACILRCQVVVDGKKTVWCAQHDETTLAPCPARSYELASLSGAESVRIVEFLLGEEHPSAEMVDAIESAVAWFEEAKIVGRRVTTVPAPGTPKGTDRVVVPDASAPPLWARFYEIGTNRPFFCSRDGIPRYRLADISYERRNGYSWLGSYADDLLRKAYPAWKQNRMATDSERRPAPEPCLPARQ